MSKPKLDKNINIPQEVLKELLTPSEIRMLKNRWQIVKLLQDGLSIRSIAERVKVGTDTVVRVSKMIESKDILKTLAKSENGKQFKSKTPWIFGKK